ncbi:GntR family transcriptional regulator, partial [Rhizobium ruizarguesonis]
DLHAGCFIIGKDALHEAALDDIMQINELELAREIGTGNTSVREFLIRFSRFGLIEKRPNSNWTLKGFTREFAIELADV